MKKILLSLALVFACVTPLAAQSVHFGLKAGGDLAGLASSESPTPFGSDFRLGWNGGAFFVFSLSDFVEFQPELQFIQKGEQYRLYHVLVTGGGVGTGYTDLTTTLSFNYLEIPLDFNFHTALAPGLEGNLQFGPSLAFLLSASDHTDAGSFGTSDRDTTPYVPSFDAGILLGVGLRLDQWLLDARYEHGLTTTDNSGAESIVNSVFTLQIGYQLF